MYDYAGDPDYVEILAEGHFMRRVSQEAYPQIFIPWEIHKVTVALKAEQRRIKREANREYNKERNKKRNDAKKAKAALTADMHV